MKNWRTTLAGIFILVISVCTIGLHALQGNLNWKQDSTAVVAAAAGIGLWKAKDAATKPADEADPNAKS